MISSKVAAALVALSLGACGSVADNASMDAGVEPGDGDGSVSIDAAIDPLPPIPGIEDPALSERYTKRTQSFDADPGWISQNSRTRFNERGCMQISQDYAFTGGRIGGRFVRTVRPGYYADRIEPVTMNERLVATGTISMSAVDDGSFHLGWFNSRMQGWRPVNSIALRLDGRSSGVANVRLDYSTATWNVGGIDTPVDIAPGDAAHTFEMIYDPDGAGGNGRVTLTIDGGAANVLDLEPGHKALGAQMDRFGLFHNQRQQGSTIDAVVDDLTYSAGNGTMRSNTFDADPGWEARNNQVSFEDCQLLDNNDFGFSDTNFAGGARGEAGGLFWRFSEALDQRISYADPVGPFDLDDYIEATGMVSFTRGSVDSGVLIGFFDENSNVGQINSGSFLGMMIEGPSSVGHYVCRKYHFPPDVNDEGGCAEAGAPVLRPDGRRMAWKLIYNPEAFDGAGGIGIVMDGQVTTYPLPPGVRASDATFTRFGLQAIRSSGNSIRLFIDDLNYSAIEAPADGDERAAPLYNLAPSTEFESFITDGQWN